MKQIRKKLKSKRGETLVETMVSMIIISLSMTLLSALLSGASTINFKAKQVDAAFYQQLTKAEKTKSATPIAIKEVTISYDLVSTTIPGVALYGTQDGLISYKKEVTP